MAPNKIQMRMEGIHPVPAACPALNANIPAPATLLTKLKIDADMDDDLVVVVVSDGSVFDFWSALRKEDLAAPPRRVNHGDEEEEEEEDGTSRLHVEAVNGLRETWSALTVVTAMTSTKSQSIRQSPDRGRQCSRGMLVSQSEAGKTCYEIVVG